MSRPPGSDERREEREGAPLALVVAETAERDLAPIENLERGTCLEGLLRARHLGSVSASTSVFAFRFRSALKIKHGEPEH